MGYVAKLEIGRVLVCVSVFVYIVVPLACYLFHIVVPRKHRGKHEHQSHAAVGELEEAKWFRSNLAPHTPSVTPRLPSIDFTALSRRHAV